MSDSVLNPDPEQCPGTAFEDGTPIPGECDGTPSKAVVLHFPDGAELETTLLFCDKCVASGWFTNADACQIFEHLPSVERKASLWLEARRETMLKPHEFAVSFRKPTKEGRGS